VGLAGSERGLDGVGLVRRREYRASRSRGVWGEGGLGERAARTPCAPRAVILPAVQSLRRACSEGGLLGKVPPPLPGRWVIIMLDRWLTPSADFRQAYGLGRVGRKSRDRVIGSEGFGEGLVRRVSSWRSACPGIGRVVIGLECLEAGGEPVLVVGAPVVAREDEVLRREVLSGLPPRPQAVLPEGEDFRRGITDTAGWSDERLWSGIERMKSESLGWKETSGSAREWWEGFEAENRHRPGLIHRLAEELRVRKATIGEFFLAYVYSNTDNIQANLYYLDYKRLRDGGGE
jgi:hypothetical protein